MRETTEGKKDVKKREKVAYQGQTEREKEGMSEGAGQKKELK